MPSSAVQTNDSLEKETVRMTRQADRLKPVALEDALAAGNCRPIVQEDDERIVLRFDCRAEQSAMLNGFKNASRH
jgi:hypothetical protein